MPFPEVPLNGDSAICLEAVRRRPSTEAAERVRHPAFRLEVGPLTAGPLLARTLRGGLFALIQDGLVAPRLAIELGVAAPDDAHDILVETVTRAATPRLAAVYATGRLGPLTWALVERVYGWPLRTLLGRHGLSFSGRRLAGLGAELADGLAALAAAAAPVQLIHGRLSVGHVVIDVAGRARLVGSPVRGNAPDLICDPMGLGVTLACAALGAAPAATVLAPAARRSLAMSLDRPENAGRMTGSLRRLLQSLLTLSPRGFLPSMAVLRDEFAGHMEGLPMGVPDPAWGRSLSEAVRGLAPMHRPSSADADAVITELGAHLPALESPVDAEPAPSLRPVIDGAELPEYRLGRVALRASE